jgi:hypothetical protein
MSSILFHCSHNPDDFALILDDTEQRARGQRNNLDVYELIKMEVLKVRLK